MAEYVATIRWERHDTVFTDQRYSRGHVWEFDGGVEVPASSSPHSVRPPYSVEAAVDPEEALVAAISSCHMLWFLSFAARRGFVVDDYRDAAAGVMGPNAEGKTAMLEVTLRPAIRFAADACPSAEELAELHHEAHEACYIANSLKTRVRVVAQ
ncbi:MAG: OsmC family protein [Gemmatimonadota bacterium]|nr:OsmC family protein [Gemmatimonadota bacterium]